VNDAHIPPTKDFGIQACPTSTCKIMIIFILDFQKCHMLVTGSLKVDGSLMVTFSNYTKYDI
jgi:hypothetical protein